MDSRLWQHQRDAVERIVRDGGVHALLHEPGAGKTLTTIAYLEHLRVELGRPVRVLIVVPKSALGVWPEQMKEHSICSSEVRVLSGPIKQRLAALSETVDTADLVCAVVPYSTFQGFRTKAAAKPVLDAVKAFAPDVIVADEMHHIRGAQSNTSKVFALLSPLCSRRIGLTGTPTPHSPADVYGMWRWLDPSAFAGPDGRMVSYTRWLQGYAQFGGFQGRQIVGWFDQEDLEERISRKSSVVKTVDCHDLPPLVVQRHSFSLSPVEQRCYDDMRRDLLAVIEDDTISAANKVVSILRLRQICAGWLPNEDGVPLQVGTTRRDLAVSLIEDLLASEKRLVVFAWSKHEVDELYRVLLENPPWGASVLRIAGDTTTTVREQGLHAFSNETVERAVLVAQADTVASGTNALVSASHALYLSLTQQGANWTQSLARLHRPGQKKTVVAHVLGAAGTIDITMLDSLQGRADAQSALMDHVREVAG